MKTRPTTYQLQKRIKQLEQSLIEVNADRDKYRSFIAKEFRNQLECLSKSQYVSADNWIKKFTTLLSDAKGGFYLGLW